MRGDSADDATAHVCPYCGSKTTDEAIRGPEGSTFRCLFCWRLFMRPHPERSELPTAVARRVAGASEVGCSD